MYRLIMQIFKFGIVGVICFLIDYLLMIFITIVLGIDYIISCAVSFVVSNVVNYKLSMKYVFKTNDENSQKFSFISFFIMSVVGLLLTELFMLLFVELLSLHYSISKIVVSGIVMIYNFITRKIFFEKN